MDVPPFTFADALLAVLAQRLARRLCSECHESYSPGKTEIEELAGHGIEEATLALLKSGKKKLWRAVGCEHCEQVGYKGRVAIHELLVNTEEIAAAIQKRATADDIRALAVKDGARSLLQDGVEKCLAGDTDLAQVFAVCSQ